MSLSSIFKEKPYNPLEHNLDLDERIERYKKTHIIPNMDTQSVNQNYVAHIQENKWLHKLRLWSLKIDFKYLTLIAKVMIAIFALCFAYVFYNLY